ncbi:MAG: iron-containing alcohol dehydrogenase [Deltaproteobacteria bacterium]|jgi:glycerol-1-phosphate dehydrogenase [NAD(P)+]|nr:iron-containing alcohol dehydrogenase [Deltaproteobacteria bacterium]MBW2534380.1 iron-containing alcohol dehydrogenase [Deltaproteobacteria bacterium]
MDLLQRIERELGGDVEGRREALPTHYFYAPDAVERFAEALRDQTAGRRALVWYDLRTREVGGRDCVAALERVGFEVLEKCIPDRPDGRSPKCDDHTKERLEREAPAADLYVAVGSGVVNDLTKWMAVEASVPYAVLGTAGSMNGYTAANVAPTIGGIKSLFRARAPRVIAAVPEVIESAPYRLTASGLGDAIAKPVSTADWLVNHLVFDESFYEPVTRIIDRAEERYLSAPRALAAHEPEAMKALFDALVLSGCAMTLVGSSLPASGGEHLVSHTIDMWSYQDGQPHDLHGRQVGVATVFAAALYQRIMAVEAPDFRPDSVPFDGSLWGDIVEGVRTEHEAKGRNMQAACTKLAAGDRWDGLRAALSPILRQPGDIHRCLREAGAAAKLDDIGCSRERFVRAILHAGAMRRRFTSLDLAYAVGVLPTAAEELVDEWLL